MKEYPTDKIRNICLAGQRGCGKTSLADALAYATGVNNRIGRVDDGSSLLDYTDSEISRRTSIQLKLLAMAWKDCKLNLFDAPGHLDFMGEFLACAKVSDVVCFVVNATAGVEVGTQLQWRSLADSPHARFIFVNKMEIENAKWQTTVESIQAAFGNHAVPVTIPIGEADKFRGMIDLLHMKAYEYAPDGTRKEIDIPADLKDRAQADREALVEMAAEASDELMEKFFDQGTLPEEDVRIGLRQGIARGKLYPILCGAAGKNWGTGVLLDFAVEFLPSPDQMPAPQAQKTGAADLVEVRCDPNGPPALFVFKTITEGHLGELAFFRVYSGAVSSGMDFVNQRTRNSERATQIYTQQGKNRSELSKVVAGDVGALVKLRNTNTGDTLTGGNLSLVIPPVRYPNPVMDVAIRPKSKGDEEKIGTGLQKISQEDPTFRIIHDAALKQMVLVGQGATQIEIITEKLKKRYGVEVDLVRPRIPYRETIRAKAETQYRHKKQSGGRGQFGDVHLRLEPNERGKGFEFLDEIKGGVIPNKYIPAVEKGVVEAMERGPLTGSQVIDVKVAVFYGSYHEVDSSDMAFKIASSMAFKQGFMQAKPVLLEPIYNVEVLVPEDFTGDVMGDLSARRGKIAGMDPAGTHQRIRAQVPQAEMYQYSVDLRSMTQGQGVYTMEFSHYEEVPHETAQKVIEEAKAAAEEAS
ncbi:MAG TPA: elongation factor G [candidate division Zixibacteria bacterium]|nr:elongation factor G [candidate division Zixibacteria bacterium]MDD4918933.1 elongation factor G [candidate division Zixibacteria bacterium]MDM7972280.1 elongation factor G [candidate division Zixibacteria bacterium]HOD67747.1 elongation factor G [candidate division Zixibacteria bacterium]HPM35922.1 elongation factor G [candidate division Zixibacteria bacterium]